MKFYLYILLLLAVQLGNAQQTPAPIQKEIFTIVGATAHIGNGNLLQNSAIVIENGKIKAIGKRTEVSPEGTTIDASGKHIYPGFIATNTTLGLIEIDAVRATDDEKEIGTFNPHIRSLIAYNAESKIVESMRPNGVLIAQVAPRGGSISGRSSVVQLDAWNWEDAVISKDDGVHMNWPSPYKQGRWWLGEDPDIKPDEDYQKNVDKLLNYVQQAKVGQNYKGDSTVSNLEFQAMQGVFNSTKRLYIHADAKKAIIDIVRFISDQKIKHPVLVGASEAYKAISELKKINLPVLLERTHSLPTYDDDDYDQPYKQAKTLSDAGILVGLQNSGDMERANTRNLPFQAGTVVAHGMDKEKALSLITLNSAKILGIDHRLGSLEKGKDATLFISKGDALDMRTNQIEKAFINGRDLSLESHQTKLWKRYSKKYEQQGQ
ncbi:amidohydrolase family protein [Aquimarina sp. ERC-38]|nr:amidohydrolase family protein [Aquimarina sp. ERC-38]UZO82710.1 amidohydrolase family protein [Aquimarina sp. ERC-38]